MAERQGALGAAIPEEQPAPPSLFVMFGATGDLSGRKIAPALYNLTRDGLIPRDTVVLGVARRQISDDQFRQHMHQAVSEHSRRGPQTRSSGFGGPSSPIDEAIWGAMAQRWHYHSAQFDRAEDFRGLAARMGELERQYGLTGRRLFYLAVAPNLLMDLACNLGKVALNRPTCEDGCVRVVVEKPFGKDLASARQLNECVLRVFDESQVYRIDHYLGKETVQNLLVLRFANAVFDPLFSRQFVDQVQITTTESAGMEGRRGAYYEEAGALRDMVQSHMLQLLALLAMDVPPRMDAEYIRGGKAAVLEAIAPMTPEQAPRRTVRGQYVASAGRPGYRQEQGVAPDSQVETFVALTLYVDNRRWAGVPFHLRTGKALGAKTSQITIVFKREPKDLFDQIGCDTRSPNRLTIRIYPNEGMSLAVDGKVPGPGMLLRPLKMDFSYGSAFESASPEAYEHLVLDALQGEATLFLRNDEVEASWRIVDSIAGSWKATGMPKLIMYPAGGPGPAEAQGLLGDPYKVWYPF